MNHQPHGDEPQFWDPDATTLLPPAVPAAGDADATTLLPPTTGAVGDADATTLLPPMTTAAGDPEATTLLPPTAPAGPSDQTQVLPPLVDGPYGGSPYGAGSSAGGRPADGAYGSGAAHGEGLHGNGPRSGRLTAAPTAPDRTPPTPTPRGSTIRIPAALIPVMRTAPPPEARRGPARGRPRAAAGGAPGRPPGGRRASRAKPRRSRGALPWLALAACAAVGLALGGVLSVMGGDTEQPARDTAVLAATTPTAATAPASAPSTPSPTPSESPADGAGPAPTTAPPVPSGRFLLVHPALGRALDVQEGSVADGAPVILWDRHGGPNQQWLVSDLGDGHVQIHAAHSGLCLAGADPRTPGSAVVQRPCAPDNIAQRWQPTAPAAGGPHTLTLQGTGLVLGASGPDNGAPLHLQQPNAADPQAWSLEAVA
ncbi:RICIN domain-containing protein [Streptomyces sp. CC210A]|uniref:RICIN domain-containing protein n=1 Tax=Streptomyces sp. CC210A TaxID=2898184 RepID=UPI001F3F9AFE|nr:RICIN domain-containing protein [Streptomyces sp. CC210A]